jgi:hypothetical protein
MKHLCIALLAAASLSSCAQTGDPNQGGLFGWSQGMANDRLAVREQHLRELERDNAYQRGRTQELEDQAARKRSQSNQY